MDSERGRERRDSGIEKEAEEKTLPIRFVGMMSREDLFAQYARSVLVFPSYIETIGLPLLEARSVGAPILAADCFMPEME